MHDNICFMLKERVKYDFSRSFCPSQYCAWSLCMYLNFSTVGTFWPSTSSLPSFLSKPWEPNIPTVQHHLTRTCIHTSFDDMKFWITWRNSNHICGCEVWNYDAQLAQNENFPEILQFTIHYSFKDNVLLQSESVNRIMCN